MRRRRRRSGDHWLRRLGTLLVGVVLGVALGAVYLVSRVEPVPPAARSVTPAGASPIRVALGAPFLTVVTRDALRAATTPAIIASVTVETGQGELIVRGELDVLGNPVPASATLHPVLRGGQLAIEVVRSELGALPVPLESALEQAINARLRPLLADLPVTVTGVSVDALDGLVVTCDVDIAQLALGRGAP